jgi:hypothetical protein
VEAREKFCGRGKEVWVVGTAGVFVDSGFGPAQDMQRDTADVKYHFTLVSKD